MGKGYKKNGRQKERTNVGNQKTRKSPNVHEDPLLMTLRAVQSASPTATISDPTTIISTRTKIRTESSRNILLVLSTGNHSVTKDWRPDKKTPPNHSSRGDFTTPLQTREAEFRFLLEQLLPNRIRQTSFCHQKVEATGEGNAYTHHAIITVVIQSVNY